MAMNTLFNARSAASLPTMAPLRIRGIHLHPLQHLLQQSTASCLTTALPLRSRNDLLLETHRNPGNVILIGRSPPISHAMLSHKISPAGKFLRLITKCSQDKDLAKKKCVPCESNNLKPMSIEAAGELLQKIPGWNILNEDGKLRLHRDWKVKTFMKGLEFFKHVADIAEAEGHHPDLHLVNWNNASIDIWTHSISGLTENDFILAAKISSLDVESLLRIKPHGKESFTAS